MIIQESRVSLFAQSEYTRQTVETESLQVWKDGPAAAAGSSSSAAAASVSSSGPVDTVTLSDGLSVDAKHLALIRLVEKMVETFTGRNIKIRPLHFDRAQRVQGNGAAQQTAPDAANGTGRVGWGVRYDATSSVFERQAVDFRATGTVKTGDGKEIGFSLNLALSRELYEETSVHLRMGDAQVVDPLVISFDGSAAQLTDAKFAFDLDCDGTQESISFLEAGSGFLVLDAEDTGTVADGSQLFGPSPGNGFSELSALDSDGNGWIDENDAAFDDLRIWTKDAAGNDVLSTLLERNVGAICLGNVEASFDLLGPGNAENGELARLGVWLEEDGGGAGIVSQVDLAV